MYNILICDDEKDIVSALEIYLKNEEYNLLTAYNGKEALNIVSKNEVHLILMDIMMPEMDGISAMSKIREISNVPIIMLTAKSESSDKILGLNIGADDYITKPFDPVEVQARIKSQLRRYTKLGSMIADKSQMIIGGINLNDVSKRVELDGEKINLTPTEYNILKLFMENPNKVFSPKEIYKAVWSADPMGAENTVVVHIRHLREKLEINPAKPRYIEAVWGQGYKMNS